MCCIVLRTGVRYGQAPALFTAPEAPDLLAAVAGSLDVRGGTRLAAATGECIGYLLETLTRLCNAPAPGRVAGTWCDRACEAVKPAKQVGNCSHTATVTCSKLLLLHMCRPCARCACDVGQAV